MPSIIWDGLIQSVEGLKKETDSPKGEGILPANFHWSQTTTLPLVFRLPAYTIDSEFASLHSYVSQFLVISLSLSHTHRHTNTYRHTVTSTRKHTQTHRHTHRHAHTHQHSCVRCGCADWPAVSISQRMQASQRLVTHLNCQMTSCELIPQQS